MKSIIVVNKWELGSLTSEASAPLMESSRDVYIWN